MQSKQNGKLANEIALPLWWLCFLFPLPSFYYCFQSFFSFLSEPSGHIVIKVWDKDRWSSDDFLGEVAVPLKGLKNGKPVEEWYALLNEPKKTKDKNPNKPPAELRLRLHFPVAHPEEEVASAPSSSTAATTSPTVNGRSPGKISDKYTFGKELGRYVSPLIIFIFGFFCLPSSGRLSFAYPHYQSNCASSCRNF